MQKDWIPQEKPRVPGLPPEWRGRSRLAACSSSSSGFLLWERDWGACSCSSGSFLLWERDFGVDSCSFGGFLLWERVL